MTAMEVPAQKQRHFKSGKVVSAKGHRKDSNYMESILQLRDIFPNWSLEDLQQVLEDLAGDVELAINRISQGHVSKWSEAGKRAVKKDDVEFKSTTKTHYQKTNRPYEKVIPQKSISSRSETTLNVNTVSSDAIMSAMIPPAPVVLNEASLDAKLEEGSAKDAANESSTRLSYYSSSSSSLVLRYNSRTCAADGNHPEDSIPTTSPTEELDLSASVAESTYQATLSSITASAQEEGKVASENLWRDEPIVQIPDKLSSSLAPFAQPVVVLPSKINVRSNLSLNFDPSIPSPTESSITNGDLANCGAGVMTDSVRTSLLNARSPKKDIIDASSDTNLVLSCHQPIQRPALPTREINSHSPPGLTPDSVFNSQSPYNRRRSGTVGGPARFSNYGHSAHHHVSDNHEAAPGFVSMYPQASMKPQQTAFYARSNGPSENSGKNMPPGIHSQSFVNSPAASWTSYPNSQHSAYYLQTPHYAQHLYPDSSYLSHAPNSHQNCQGAYSLHQHPARYSSQGNAQQNYSSASFQPQLYSVHQHYYSDQHPSVHPRPPNSPTPRQASGDAFPQKHGA